MDVSDVLRDRLHEPSGLSGMLSASLFVHGAVVALVLFAPANWMFRKAEPPKNVMTISLGGTGAGPANGGMTAAAARAVQAEVPPEDLKKREAVRAPAAQAPEMVIPTTKTVSKSSKSTPVPEVKSAPDQARGRTLTKGLKESPGNAIAKTDVVRGLGFGLSTGGGPGSGSTLDVADFCCPDYIATMIDRIRGAWQQNQGSVGTCNVRFTIQRDGTLTAITLARSSGSTVLDNAALRAVFATKTLNPLPGQFPNPTLTVNLNFQY
jgi:protein TonB